MCTRGDGRSSSGFSVSRGKTNPAAVKGHTPFPAAGHTMLLTLHPKTVTGKQCQQVPANTHPQSRRLFLQGLFPKITSLSLQSQVPRVIPTTTPSSRRTLPGHWWHLWKQRPLATAPSSPTLTMLAKQGPVPPLKPGPSRDPGGRGLCKHHWFPSPPVPGRRVCPP